MESVGSCHICAQLVTGPIVLAGELQFHPECFACVECEQHIEEGDPYTLIEKEKLYCAECYKEHLLRVAAANTPRRRSHCIQKVEIGSDDNCDNIKLTLETCAPTREREGRRRRRGRRVRQCVRIKTLSDHPSISDLQIGDKVLEVNGDLVANQSIEELNSQIEDTSHILITVERDHVASCKSMESLCVSQYKTKKLSLDLPPCDHTESCHSPPINRRKERSSSLPRVDTALSPCRLSLSPWRPKSGDLRRVQTFRIPSADQRVFRAADLIIGDVLGKGFFGQARKVVHRITGETMVLKELFKFNVEAQKQFLKEVSVLRSLDHPNVLRFLGILYKDRRLNLITEYIPGGTLKERLKDITMTLPWITRVLYARDVALGMAYLHTMDIVHRDLNSYNCLIKEDNSVVVADFGLARIITHIEATHKITDNTLLNSPTSMQCEPCAINPFTPERHVNTDDDSNPLCSEISNCEGLEGDSGAGSTGLISNTSSDFSEHMQNDISISNIPPSVIIQPSADGSMNPETVTPGSESPVHTCDISYILDIKPTMGTTSLYLQPIPPSLNSCSTSLSPVGPLVDLYTNIPSSLMPSPTSPDMPTHNLLNSPSTPASALSPESPFSTSKASQPILLPVTQEPHLPASTPTPPARRYRRKKRYTVVGNPYWMAPEMINGNIYDEKVDVFSFGIVVCEIIGRVDADPDYLPRNKDFGLNASTFHTKFVTAECPTAFFKLALKCCQIIPDNRPSFEEIYTLFEGLRGHMELGMPVPGVLQGDPLQFAREADLEAQREKKAKCLSIIREKSKDD